MRYRILTANLEQLRQNPHRQDHHTRGRVKWYHRQCQEQDPGQGGHPAWPAASDLRRQAVGGWPYAERLQHPEGRYMHEMSAGLGTMEDW